MSWFTTLRDNVIKPAVGAVLAVPTGGASLAVVAADAAAKPGSLNFGGSGTSAAPSGSVGSGGVPNKNPGIFSTVSNQTLLLVAAGLLGVLLFIRMRR
jgi:hypothetical protein